MFRLSDGEEIMTLAFFFDTIPECDGRTDGRTDRQTDNPLLAIPAVCIARYANALVKFDNFAYPTPIPAKIWGVFPLE